MPKFPTGDKVYVGDNQVLDSVELAALLAGKPVLGTPTINAGKTIVTLPFGKPIFPATADAAALKAKITVATDGTTFAALNASDTVAIYGENLVITLNSAWTLATNKLKIGADALMHYGGGKNAEITTPAISAA
jgi:hypothetical protein